MKINLHVWNSAVRRAIAGDKAEQVDGVAPFMVSEAMEWDAAVILGRWILGYGVENGSKEGRSRSKVRKFMHIVQK